MKRSLMTNVCILRVFLFCNFVCLFCFVYFIYFLFIYSAVVVVVVVVVVFCSIRKYTRLGFI